MLNINCVLNEHEVTTIKFYICRIVNLFFFLLGFRMQVMNSLDLSTHIYLII